MASEWFYTLNGQQVPVPASAAALRQLAANGQLQPTDLIWQEGMPNWLPASSIKGLFGGKPATGEFAAVSEKSGSSSKLRPRKPIEEPKPAAEADEDASTLHPLAALALTILTGGLFGLFYAYRVCSAFAGQAPPRATDSNGRALGRPRHPVGVMILSYVTLGIYFPFWLCRVQGECNAYLGRKNPNGRLDATLGLLFPPYAVYLSVFRLPALIRGVRQQAKLEDGSSVVPAPVLLSPLLFFALPVLGMAQQDALNQAWLSAP